MRRNIALLMLGCALMATPGAAPVELSESQQAALSEEIQRAIHRLGDDSYSSRQDAAKELREIGAPALAALRTAARSTNPETAGNATKLLDSLRLTLDPIIPPEAAAILQQYANAGKVDRQALIGRLMQTWKEDVGALLLLAETETDPELRHYAMRNLYGEPHHAMRYMMERGQVQRLEAFLDEGCRRESPNQITREWAAYTILRGYYEAQRNRLEAQSHDGPPDQRNTALRKLLFLHRAHGDLDKSLTVAKQLDDPTLLYCVQVERAVWPAVAAFEGKAAIGVDLKYYAPASGALAAKFAGDRESLGKLVASFEQNATEKVRSDGRYAGLLKLLDRPNEASEAMIRSGYGEEAVELLAERGCFKEAFVMAERAKFHGARDLPGVLLWEAYMFHSLGETERATAMLDGLGNHLLAQLGTLRNTGAAEQGGDPPGWTLNESIGRVAGAWKRFGREETGLRVAAAFLERFPPVYPAPRYSALYYSSFGDGADYDGYAAILHDLRPQLSMLEILRIIADISANRMKPGELEALAREMHGRVRELEKNNGDPQKAGASKDRLRRWSACLLLNLEAAGAEGEFADRLAREAVATEKPDHFDWHWQQAMLQRGRKAARNRDWVRALAAYETVAETTKKDWPRYIEGLLLVEAGLKVEGEILQRRTKLLMMGAQDERYSLGEEAAALGMDAVAREQWEWLLRTGQPIDVYWINAAMRLVGNGKLDMSRRQRLIESFLVAYSRGGSAMTGPRADAELAISREQHDTAARAAAVEKDWKVVLHEVRAANELYPTNIDLLVDLAPQLDSAGLKAETDALVSQRVAYFEELVAAFPRAADLHNSLAWLCGRTRRSLDVGLQHAKAAVASFPRNAEYLDTLAEVHFARGEFATAVEVERKAVELAPTSQIMRDSLKRFEAALEKK